MISIIVPVYNEKGEEIGTVDTLTPDGYKEKLIIGGTIAGGIGTIAGGLLTVDKDKVTVLTTALTLE